MKSVGSGRHRVLRSGTRVLHLRQRALGQRHVGLLQLRSILKKPPGTRARNYEHGNKGYRPTVKGGYFPTPPVDSAAGHALRDVPDPRARWASRSKCITTKSRNARPDGNRHQVQHAGAARRLGAAAEVRDPERRAQPTARRPRSCRSPSSATTARACTCHQSVWKDGKNLFAGDGYAGLSISRCTTSAASSSMPVR